MRTQPVQRCVTLRYAPRLGPARRRARQLHGRRRRHGEVRVRQTAGGEQPRHEGSPCRRVLHDDPVQTGDGGESLREDRQLGFLLGAGVRRRDDVDTRQIVILEQQGVGDVTAEPTTQRHRDPLQTFLVLREQFAERRVIAVRRSGRIRLEAPVGCNKDKL